MTATLSSKTMEILQQKRKAGILDDLFLLEITTDLAAISCTATIMAQRSEGVKRENWENMEFEINRIKTFITQTFLRAKREAQANAISPCGNLLLIEENKRLKTAYFKLKNENEFLKNTIERYVDRFGV